MGRFFYKAKSGPGQIHQGLLEAESRALALEKLSAQKLFPILVEEKGEEAGRSVLAPGKIKDRDIVFFARQLADLWDSGLPLLKALTMAQEQSENPALARTVEDMAALVREGKSLSEAMAASPHIFSPIQVSLVRSGEAGGFLGKALEQMSELAEKEEELKAKVRAALAYPALIAVVGAATVVFLMGFVVPRLASLFLELGQEMPLPTRLLMGASAIFRGYGWLLLAAAGGAGLMARRHGAALAPRIDRFLLGLPVWGPLAKKLAVARFAETLGVLLASGVSLVEALHIVSGVLGHASLGQRVRAAAAAVGGGAGLADSLRGVFPPVLCNMVAIGEEGNTLEKSLHKVSATFGREADRSLKLFTSLLEPLMILAVGGLVALVVVGILLPVFQAPTFLK